MKNIRIELFTELAEFDGKIICAAGAVSGRVLICQAEGTTISAECSAEMLERIARHAGANSFRVMGYATWERTDEGRWNLIRFRASDFRLLRNKDLAGSVARLRKIMLAGRGVPIEEPI